MTYWAFRLKKLGHRNVYTALQLQNENPALFSNNGVYRAYSDDLQMLELEAGAQKKKLGLWMLPTADRVPPWEWILSPAGRDSE
jgi:hypothetical protein